MKIVGLIAEYNPFHNGHRYHIEQAKKIAGADHAVVVMSGDYVQRGIPACMPKRLRAEMALKCGASAVFELPVCYATGSAELFAEGAVSLLDRLGIVDTLVFGSECNDLESLSQIADLLVEEPELYRTVLRFHLKNGASYPMARQEAVSACLRGNDCSFLLNDPNNILGIEYLKALKRQKSRIIPYTIARRGAHYHDPDLHDSYSSASAIRSLLAYSGSAVHIDHADQPEYSGIHHILGELEHQVPESCLELLKDHHRIQYPICQNDFSLILKYKLLNKKPDSLIRYMDVSQELANRICAQLNHYFHYQQFCELLKTRELTQTRVNRALLHIMLGIKKKNVAAYTSDHFHYYAHLLGFRKDSEKVISAAARHGKLPLLTRLYDAGHLPESGQKMLTQDVLASNLYTSVVTDKYKTAFKNEYNQGILKI